MSTGSMKAASSRSGSVSDPRESSKEGCEYSSRLKARLSRLLVSSLRLRRGLRLSGLERCDSSSLSKRRNPIDVLAREGEGARFDRPTLDSPRDAPTEIPTVDYPRLPPLDTRVRL